MNRAAPGFDLAGLTMPSNLAFTLCSRDVPGAISVIEAVNVEKLNGSHHLKTVLPSLIQLVLTGVSPNLRLSIIWQS